jgi:hypothetical protein
MTGDQDTIYAMPARVFEPFSQAVRRLGIAEDIRNVGTVVGRMVEIANAYLDRQEGGDEGT